MVCVGQQREIVTGSGVENTVGSCVRWSEVKEEEVVGN